MRVLAVIFSLGFITVAESLYAQSGLEGLSWMAGYWTAEDEGTKMKELWMPAAGDMMVGLHRDTFASGNTFFEYLRIVVANDEIRYIASPAGKTATEFLLTELSQHRVMFENPDHDFPQRIIYRLQNDTTLVARAEAGEGESLEFLEWKWYRSTLFSEY